MKTFSRFALLAAGSSLLILSIQPIFMTTRVRAQEPNPSVQDAHPLVTELKCGKNLIFGQILINESGLTVLKVYPETSSEYEIRILDMPSEKALLWNHLYVALEVTIEKNLKQSNPYPIARFIQFQSFVSEEHSQTTANQIIQEKLCGSPSS